MDILMLADDESARRIRAMLPDNFNIWHSQQPDSIPKTIHVILAVQQSAAAIEQARTRFPQARVVIVSDTAPGEQEFIPMSRLTPQLLRAALNDDMQPEDVVLVKQAIDVISDISATSRQPEQAINALFDVLHSLIPYRGINVRLMEGGVLRMTYWRNYDPAALRVLEDDRTAARFPLLEQVYYDQQIIYVPETQTEPDWVTNESLSWVRSWVGVPIVQGEQVIGTLNMSADHPNAFQEQHFQRLRTVMQPMSVLLHVVQLQEQVSRTNSVIEAIRRQNDFLFTPLVAQKNLDALCQTIAESVVKAFGKTDCGVMLLNKNGTELQRLARAGEYHVQSSAPLYMNGDGLAVEAARTGSMVYAPDVSRVENYVANEPRTRSELVIPLKTHAEVIGVLDLQSTEVDAFSYHDWQGVIGFFHHAAVAIQNLRLYEASRRHAEELEGRVRQRTSDLDSARQRAEAILNRTSEAIALLSMGSSISQTNHAFDVLFEIAPDEYYGHPIDSIAVPDQQDRVLEALAETVRLGSTVVEVTLKKKGGDSFEAELTFSPVHLHDDSKAPDLVCSIRDISKYKAIESSLRRSLEKERELNELKTRFLLTVTHEFRTPLTVIGSSGELMRDLAEKMSPERREQHLERILEQVEHMEAMLEDALLVTSAQEDRTSFQPKALNVVQLCSSAVATLNQAHGKPFIRFHHSEGDAHAKLDRTMLQQIVNNLLTNAIKYAPASDHIDFHLALGEQEIVLTIRDYGVGIPANEMKLLFQPFFRAKNVTAFKGTGLGLSIVKYAVEHHNGQIDVESTEGEGTTFTIRLPR